jgi:DNA-binding SARP family transcriptional activator/tetratricopeptide (TPR) repeat protein
MARLALTLLGGFQARLGAGPPLTLPTKKIQALLAYLALPPGREHARDKLAVLLWGDLSQGHARHSLRQALFALRQAVAPVRPACLRIEGATIALNPDVVDIDAISFERLVGERTPTALAQAVELYRGDLLDGLTLQEPPFEDWLMAERERLRELAVEALAGLLAAQRAAGAVDAALQTGLRLIARDPLQEPLHRTLMRLYAQLGRRGAALHQYQLCVGILQRDLGIEPEEETKQLYQEILRRPLLTTPSKPAASGGSDPFASIRRPPLVFTRDTPLIGRDQEMTRLRAALAEAVSGQGRVVAFVGEAGVGKTRLVAELAAEVPAGSTRVLIGRCHESEQILPFGPWVDAFRAGRVGEDREWFETLPLAMRRELGRLLPELGPGNGESAAPPDYLQLFEGVSLLLSRVADRRPTVLILEDLHWADEMSIRLLAFISRRLQAWHLLVIVTAREEELVDAPMLHRTLGELARESDVTRLALRPLSRSDTFHLVAALSRPGSDGATAARLEEEVWRASGGNPLVVVEAIRAATQHALSPGLEGLPLPERVSDIIGRQLDRLCERSRELVTQASVVGREFEFALLQHLSGLGEEEVARGVEELTRRRLLHSVDERFDFTHDRVREVAYSRVLVPRRKVLHRRVAEALATLHAGNLEPHHLALGQHYSEGEVWDQAVLHLRRAGARAAKRSANREALACFDRALAALAHLPENRSSLEQAFEIRLELRTVLSWVGEIRLAKARLCEAEALAERLNDDSRRGRVCAFMTNIHSQLGELDEGLAYGGRALEIAGRLGDLRLRILAASFLEQAHFFRGEYKRAVELATENLEALPADWVSEHVLGAAAPASVYDRHWLVLSLAYLGRFDEAAPYEAEMIRLAEVTQHAHTIGLAYSAAGSLHLQRSDWVRARPLIEHAIAVLRTANVVNLLAALAASTWVLAQHGECSEALNRLRESEQLIERLYATGPGAGGRGTYHWLGRTCLLLGRLDETWNLGNRAVEANRSQPGLAAHALHLLGDIATHPDRFDAERGEAHYRQALALAEPRGMRPLVAHCHLGLGKLYLRTGKREEAQEHLTTATTMYREMDMRFYLEQAEAETRSSGY